MTLAYNIGIGIYYLLVLLVSPFNQKARFWVNGRKKWAEKLKAGILPGAQYAWFHASSLGEFEQGRPIMEALKQQSPDIKILLTFFSPSGFEIRKNYTGADFICYLPLDTKRNARKFIQIVNPEQVFFVKYEYWYHFLKQLKQSRAKLYLVSGIFRKEQLFFKPYGRWYRKMLGFFDHLFVQNNESAALLGSVGILNHSVAGDSRFDRVAQLAAQSKDIEAAGMFVQGARVIVAGSTWEPDEQILAEYMQTAANDIKLVIAPHEIDKAHIAQLKEKIKLPYTLFSEAVPDNLKNSRVLIIDNIGMLSSLYKYGHLAYIGGGFGAGIHNILEAAVYGIPVVFGPKYNKFAEALDMLNIGAAYSVNNQDGFKQLADNFFSNDNSLRSAGEAAAQYVNRKTGATTLILNHLKKTGQ